MKPEELKKIRKELKLSQAKLAKKLKISSQTIAKWEKGLAKIPYASEDFIMNIYKYTIG